MSDADPLSPISPTQEERSWAMAAHAGQILAIPLSGGALCWAVPLVIWLVKKDESTFVEEHAKEALNFQITLLLFLLLYAGVSGILICLLVGLLLLWAIPVLYVVPVVVFGIQGTLAANRGEAYRYPFILRLVP